MKRIIDYLEELGLTDIESKLYVGLLNKGKTTVRELAESVGMNRTTAYPHVHSLICEGLISETRKGARRQIIAEPPDRLHYFIDRKIETTKRLEEKFPSIVNTIESSFPKIKDSANIEIKYYQGKKGVKLIYEDVLKAKELRAYVTAKLDDFFPENPQLFISTLYKRKSMKIWEILDHSPVHSEYLEQMSMSGRYLYKIIKESIPLVDYLIYEGKVAIIDGEPTRKDSVMGFLINNKNFYNSSKKLFDFIWNL